ncbi:hypothetical protein V494_00223 [Pseudogymnoascus sp. VKM F-4513 (FW-928)]|nr:hypothetical protein V494_00223 [Pseudogymnoascus sp. VKM F-4513 (FW-928)]
MSVLPLAITARPRHNNELVCQHGPGSDPWSYPFCVALQHKRAADYPSAAMVLRHVEKLSVHVWGEEHKELKTEAGYGTKTVFMSTMGKKIDGTLLRGSHCFGGSEKNSGLIILTSPDTLRARHGSSKLLDHRVANLG